MRTNRIFWILLLGVGIYGGYFGYCRYKAIDGVRAFERQGKSLRQFLLQQKGEARAADIRSAVGEFAEKAQVELDSASLQVTVEALTPESVAKLTTIEQRAFAIAGRIGKHRAPRYVVGFSVAGKATHGIASRAFVFQHYTWVDDAVIEE